jgi:hypothetical protein
MFSLKPDYERTKARIEAFWHCALIDRPVVQFYLGKPPDERLPLPSSNGMTSEQKWLDVQYRTEMIQAELSNQYFLGDTLPVAFPNLGPEILSAFYGCPMHYGDYGTSWTDSILHDWSHVEQVKLDWQHPLLIRLYEMTDAFITAGMGRFITGLTDFHPGGDHLAALRDPQNLALDMIEHLDEVKRALVRFEQDYYQIYDVFYHKLRRAGLPITSWTPLLYDGRYYIPSNDFSIMVSKKMYDEVFLPGIIRECQFYDRSIYHLDGPGALRHLDSILAIKELNALQWVFGAGNEGYHRWIGVYQKVQKAGKGIQVNCDLDEVELVTQTLDPHGVYLNVGGVPDLDSAQALLKRLEKWTVNK